MESFQCSVNLDVESFLKKSAIRFDKQHIARTYLIMDEDNPSHGVIAFFTLSFKEVHLLGDVSKSTTRKLDGISKNASKIKFFLLGQVGKNDNVTGNISFIEILQFIYSKLIDAHETIGGRALLLECGFSPKLISLYEKAGFKQLQTEEFVQMYQILDFEVA